jgi:hypothetical protein
VKSPTQNRARLRGRPRGDHDRHGGEVQADEAGAGPAGKLVRACRKIDLARL